jgi:YggT family protein
MNGGYFAPAAVFVLDTALGLLIGAVMLRLLLQWVRADFYNPLSQAIVKLTNPLLRPLRRYIPALGRIDTASLVLMLVLQLINLWLAIAISGGAGAVGGLLVMSLAALLSKLLYLYTFAIFVQVIASWVSPGGRSAVLDLVDSLTEPVLRPLQRRLPPLGGLDLSPMLALMLLQLALMLVAAPLRDLGVSLL